MFKENRVGDTRDSCDIEALIRLAPGHEPIPCVVVDISERGARLAVAFSTFLPDRFILALPLIDDHYDERRVEVRWRKAEVAGVRFLRDESTASDTGSPKLVALGASDRDTQ